MIVLSSVYCAMSLITFIAYALDKRASIKNKRRVPEATLHLLALLGGMPGALIAQRIFKHKRRKCWFMTITILITLLHIAAWIAWYVLIYDRR